MYPLPPVERRSEIKFYLAKSFSYELRLFCAFIFILAGFGIQICIFEEFFFSLPLLFLGVLLLLVKGYDNQVETRTVPGDWKETGKAEVERIIEINDKSSRWDQDFLDITCGWGCLGFFLVGGGIFVGALVLEDWYPGCFLVVFLDAIVLLLPFWFTGVRFILKNDKLIVKTKLLLQLERIFEEEQQAGENWIFQMQTFTAKDGKGETPSDLKAMIRFSGGPKDLYGLQMQVSINDIQGASYPYYYCVLVSKKSFDAMHPENLDEPPSNIILEWKDQEDVNVTVIRQYTTRKSGYHTPQSACENIFLYALDQVRKVLREKGQEIILL